MCPKPMLPQRRFDEVMREARRETVVVSAMSLSQRVPFAREPCRPSLSGHASCSREAAMGIEPMNRGFADRLEVSHQVLPGVIS